MAATGGASSSVSPRGSQDDGTLKQAKVLLYKMLETAPPLAGNSAAAMVGQSATLSEATLEVPADGRVLIGAATSPSAVADCISSAVPQQQSTPMEVSDRDSGDAISVSSVEMVPSTLKRPSQGEDSSRAEGPHRTDDAEIVPPPTFQVPRVQRTMYTESDYVPWLLAEWYTIRD